MLIWRANCQVLGLIFNVPFFPEHFCVSPVNRSDLQLNDSDVINLLEWDNTPLLMHGTRTGEIMNGKIKKDFLPELSKRPPQNVCKKSTCVHKIKILRFQRQGCPDPMSTMDIGANQGSFRSTNLCPIPLLRQLSHRCKQKAQFVVECG